VPDEGPRLFGIRPVLAVLGVICVLLGVVIWLQSSSDRSASSAVEGSRGAADDPSSPTTTPTCGAPAHPFRPVRVTVPGVVQGVRVLATRRDSSGVPGVPPLTDTGKHQFAWDAGGIRPGDPHGHVLMNAHAWPDGSALGNALRAHLHVGDLVVVRGARGLYQCYRVHQRLVVPFPDSPRRVLARYYATTGSPRLALVTCSGRRLAPGVWTHRTLWFARPVH
jgi:hypothetical protein